MIASDGGQSIQQQQQPLARSDSSTNFYRLSFCITKLASEFASEFIGKSHAIV
jgi:hypothetical protein